MAFDPTPLDATYPACAKASTMPQLLDEAAP
jgi:hypothetical protein